MKGNVQLASEDQFDELRICVVKGFDKLRGRFGQDVVQGWIGNQPSIDRLLEGLVPPEKKVEQPKKAVPENRMMKLDLGNVPVNAMPRMKTAECLKKGIKYPDADLERWLSEYVPAIGAGTLCGFELTDQNGTTYRQISESLLGLPGTTSSDSGLKELLRNGGHTFHPEQAADLLRRTAAGENTGLLKNGKANLLFIEDENGQVFGLSACWDDDWRGGGWGFYVYRFGHAYGWAAGYRFFSRNKV
jgi:hypothetical protein